MLSVHVILANIDYFAIHPGGQKDDIDKQIFSCAFGPGLTLESMLLQASYV